MGAGKGGAGAGRARRRPEAAAGGAGVAFAVQAGRPAVRESRGAGRGQEYRARPGSPSWRMDAPIINERPRKKATGSQSCSDREKGKVPRGPRVLTNGASPPVLAPVSGHPARGCYLPKC